MILVPKVPSSSNLGELMGGATPQRQSRKKQSTRQQRHCGRQSAGVSAGWPSAWCTVCWIALTCASRARRGKPDLSGWPTPLRGGTGKELFGLQNSSTAAACPNYM